MNRVWIIGNLTRDPEIRHSASGDAVAGFCLAINHRVKRGDKWVDDPTFVDCEAWKWGADKIEKRCQLGTQISVDGRLKLDKWVTKDGEPRQKIIVVCDRIEVLGREKPQEEPPKVEGKSRYVTPPEGDIPF